MKYKTYQMKRNQMSLYSRRKERQEEELSECVVMVVDKIRYHLQKNCENGTNM